jgi:predicted phosphodiesterase
MRLLVLSDLHLEFGAFEPPAVAADLVVLAGDIAHGADGIAWAARHFAPARTVVVAGNHEFYGGELNAVIAACRDAAAETGVRFLENEAAVIAGVRVLGCTLWSDFRLFGADRQAAAMRDAAAMMNDFRLVGLQDAHGWRRRLRPDDLLPRHAAARAFLADALAEPFAGPTVVVTHFLPHRGSVAPAYADHPLTPAFASDLAPLFGANAPALWVHGHTHESCDYRVGAARVVCNPRGYWPSELNPRFDPGLVVEV